MAAPSQNIELESGTLKKRAVGGFAFLGIRQIFVQVISFSAMIVLARTLSPNDFGIYGIASLFITVVAFFGDVGLAASLIQQPERPTLNELRTAFAFQQMLVMAVVLIGFFAVALVAPLWELSAETVWLTRSLMSTLLLSSLRTIPSMLLERQLRYGRLMAIDLIQSTTFYCLAVGLALAGYGVWSFAIATISAAAVGTAIAWVLNPWKIGFAFDRQVIRRLVTFGGPFQLNDGTALVRDNLIPILGGIAFGATAVGYLNWALSLTVVPSRLAHILGRLSFPVYSRLQDQPQLLKRTMEHSLLFLFATAMPLSLAIAAFAPQIIEYVFSDKWRPALPAVYLITINILGSYIMTPFIPAINALGYTARTLRITVIWTATSWLLAIFATRVFGFTGIAVAYALAITVAVPLTTRELRRSANIEVWKSIRAPIVAGLPVIFCGGVVGHYLIHNLLMLFIIGGITGLAYLIGLYFTLTVGERQEIYRLLASVRGG
jgi:PST family polysaccharide transporter